MTVYRGSTGASASLGGGGVHFFVSGNRNENEILLNDVLNSLYGSISLLLRGHVEDRALLENIDLILLILDELVDNGIPLEDDSTEIVNRVTLKGLEGSGGGGGGVPFSVSQALVGAKANFLKGWQSGNSGGS